MLDICSVYWVQVTLMIVKTGWCATMRSTLRSENGWVLLIQNITAQTTTLFFVSFFINYKYQATFAYPKSVTLKLLNWLHCHSLYLEVARKVCLHCLLKYEQCSSVQFFLLLSEDILDCCQCVEKLFLWSSGCLLMSKKHIRTFLLFWSHL